MKNFSKIGSITVLFILLATPLSMAFADGGLWVHRSDVGDWMLRNMSGQFAAINYQNGIEKLLLSINPQELKGEKAVWVFPVPASPDKTALDIVEEVPGFSGKDIKVAALGTASKSFGLMSFSQIYTLPLWGFYWIASQSFNIGAGLPSVSWEGIERGVTVHERIEKMGLTTELITAKNEAAFYNYLQSKDLSFPSDAQNIMKNYIGSDYSFVVSWVSNVSEFDRLFSYPSGSRGPRSSGPSISVLVVFPTDKIYFPLKLTGVYDSVKIPILVHVLGYVAPEVYQAIANDTEINYQVQAEYSIPDNLVYFFNQGQEKTVEKLKYTEIKINTPSKYLTEDLWISDSASAKIAMLAFVNDYVWFWGLLVFILFSCLASVVSGVIVFAGQKPSVKKFALLGFANLLTLAGMIFVVRKLRIPETFCEVGEVDEVDESSPKVNVRLLTKRIGITFLILFLFFLWAGGGDFFKAFLISLFIFLLIFPPMLIWGYLREKPRAKTKRFLFLFSLIFVLFTLILSGILGVSSLISAGMNF